MTDRVLLTLGTLAFAALCYLLMLKGWRGRQHRQSDLPPPPAPPSVPGQVLVGAVSGLFVGTTFTGDWLDRVAVHSLSDRSAAWLRVATDGVHLEREGLPELYLPFPALVDAELGAALAGKFVGRDGLLLLTWHLGNHTVTSGFRADDSRSYARLLQAVRAHLPVSEAS